MALTNGSLMAAQARMIAAAEGVDRVFIEQAGIDLSFRPMRDWLFFRKTVHPELKDEVLIDEYLCGYFGPAAGPMRQYYERLAALTESGDKPYFETPASVSHAFSVPISMAVKVSGIFLRSPP